MLKRSDDTLALLSNPNAFALLTIIAIRARRTDSFNVHSLKPGEALVGDYASCGLTRQQYRTALSKLEMWKFIATTATNKGTIATLADTRIYDINKSEPNQQDNHPATTQQPTDNQQTTTNNNVNNENNVNNDNIYTLQQCENEFFKQGGTDEDAKAFFTHYDSQGWLKGNKLPITSLSSQVTNWRLNPKQYEAKEDKDDFMRKVKEHAANRDRREGKGIMASVNTGGDRTTDENLF